jgi:hypothetical protein
MHRGCLFFCLFNEHDLISVPVSGSTRQSIWSSCYSLVWLDSCPCLTATQCYRWSNNCNDHFARNIVCGQHEYLDASGTGNVTSCRGHGQQEPQLYSLHRDPLDGEICCLFWWETLLQSERQQSLTISRTIDSIQHSGVFSTRSMPSKDTATAELKPTRKESRLARRALLT